MRRGTFSEAATMNRPISAQVSAPSALAGAADVRIARIETIPLKVRLDRTAVGANLKFTHRCAIVTRVYTDARVLGECFNGGDHEQQGAIMRGLAAALTTQVVRRAGQPIPERLALTRAPHQP